MTTTETTISKPVVSYSDDSHVAALELIDGARVIMELWRPYEPYNKILREAWLKRAKELVP